MAQVSDDAERAVQPLYRRVAERLATFDERLQPALADDVLWVNEPTSQWPVLLGVAGDGRGSFKLYAAAKVDLPTSRALGPTLGRLLGMVQVLRLEDVREVRRWSPYRIEDIERTPAEADDWAASTMQTILEELRPRVAWVPPAVTFSPTLAPTHEVATTSRSSGGDQVDLVEPEPKAREGRHVHEAPEVPSPRPDPELERLNRELAALSANLAQVSGERDIAVARARELELQSPAVGGDPAEHLVASFELIADGGARVGTCISVLRRFLQIDPRDRRLRELLGIYLLQDDQVADAITTLSALGSDGLTPRGASALVEADFRQRRVPEPLDVLARVDWRVGKVAQQLREVPHWVRREQLLAIATQVAPSAPPEFETFLREVARTVGRDQLSSLFDLWFDMDPAGALDELLDWVRDERVQLTQGWVQDGVRLALSSDERRTARTALDLLSADAGERRDALDLMELVDAAGQLLRPAELRKFTIRWLNDVASFTAEAPLLDRVAANLVAVLSGVSTVREEDPEHALALVLERRVTATRASELRLELERLRPTEVTVRDITTVAEALKAAAERYPALDVLRDAERSAARRGTVAVKKAREALFALGDVAERYAAGELDAGLDVALSALPDFKPDISDTAKSQYRKSYLKTLPDGRRVQLGPHFDIGGEDGRGYLFIDKDRKRIVLGHCGNHLPGKRDN